MPDSAGGPRVAVLGAGIAGAAAADALTRAGASVRVFDKARGPGGRMASRRVTLPDGTETTFDHGAQWFAPCDPRFAALVADAERAGAVAPWRDAPGGAMVGTPRMNALVRHALGGAEARYGATISQLDRQPDGWHLADADGPVDAPFDGVLSTLPAPQFGPLAAPHVPSRAQAADAARYAPCWALMLAFAPDTAAQLEGIAHDALAADGFDWVAFDGGKPGRRGATLMVHADGVWSTDNLERPREDIADAMTATVCGRFDLPVPVHAAAHRWRYSRVLTPAPAAAGADVSGIAVAGDWTAGPNVEDAYLSGLNAAAALLSVLRV
ncbi:FAD-dependent oxidoreductase [Acuticoccus sp. MNP-M23]|uniref:NAD(P)/FAD-dependent oxidoreductase n=1 Tax=Acuticoccus sp. MNP-M23 TaxID=3072793 RepID=UPI002815EB0B|nr:FAD-dependent oxidoreductase [Acuticoccus sp. MNP-M23]WMS41601.1 FAD-dependent oxidoreductase [Acuticoccus sp. MNP-M23]